METAPTGVDVWTCSHIRNGLMLLSGAKYLVCGQDDVFCMDCDVWLSHDGGIRRHLDQTECQNSLTAGRWWRVASSAVTRLQVWCWLWRRYQEAGQYSRRPGHMTTPRQDPHLVTFLLEIAAVQLDRWKLTSTVLLEFTYPTRLLGIDTMTMYESQTISHRPHSHCRAPYSTTELATSSLEASTLSGRAALLFLLMIVTFGCGTICWLQRCRNWRVRWRFHHGLGWSMLGWSYRPIRVWQSWYNLCKILVDS